MPRRTQVQYQPPRQALEPVASPQSRPFVPRLPPDVLLPVDELAGLSQTLQQISTQQAERDFDEKRQSGLDAAAGAPTDVIEALAQAHKDQDGVDARNRAVQEVMAKAVREGRIHVSQDPAVHVGFVQGAAHRIMAGYDAKLAEQMAAATATQDANGDPVVARNPDELIQEVWNQYKDNPLFGNYYGSKVAQQMKSESDSRFTESAAKKLGENRVNDTINWSTQALTDKFFGLGVSGEEPDEKTWTDIRAWADELYLKTGGKADRKKIMFDAMKGAASRMDANDSGESGLSKAAELLRDLRDAPIGTTTAGKDAAIVPELEALIADYDRQHKTKAESAARAEGAQDTKAVDTAEREFFAELDKAREAGNGAADVIAVSDKYLSDARESNKFGERMGLVADSIRASAINSGKQQGTIQLSQLMRELEAGGDADALAYNARILYKAGSIDEGSYRAFQNEVQARKSVRHLIEESPLSQNRHKDLNTAAEVPGIPQSQRGEIGTGVQSQNRRLVDEFEAREVQAMKEINALPKEQQDSAQRKWYDENVPELTKTLEENGRKFSTDQATALAAVQDSLAHSQDPETLLVQHGDLLSSEQKEFFRARAIQATDYESLTMTPAYQRSEAFVLGEVKNKYKDDPDAGLLIETAQRAMHDLFVDTVGEKLAASDPNKKASIVATSARELSDTVLAEVAAKKLARFEEAAEPGGETVPEAKAILDSAAEDRAAALNALKAPNREQAAASLPANENTNVSEDLKSLQVAYAGGTSDTSLPFFGAFQTVNRGHVEARAYSEATAALANTKLSPTDRAQAVVDMYRYAGLSIDDLSKGVLTIRPPEEWSQKVREYVARGRKGAIGANKVLLDSLEAELAKPPQTIPLTGVKIAPYTTPLAQTEAEWRLVVDTREPELRKVAKNLGVPTDDRAFKEWIRLQNELIKQRNSQE